MKIVILGIVLFAFIVEIVLSCVRYRSLNEPFSYDMSNIYDKDTFFKSKAYHKDNLRVQFVTKIVFYFMVLLILSFDLVFRINNLLSQSIDDTVWVDVFTTVIVGLPLFALEATKRIFYSLVIDNRYGFIKSTTKALLVDLSIKAVIGSISLVALILSISSKHYFGIILTLVMIFVVVIIYRKVVFKLKPLEESSLKEKIIAYASNHQFRLKNIYLLNASKRSARVNAYFQGAGRRRKIVLYDTLIDKLSEGEILAVFAHETGHAKHKDGIKSIPLNFVVYSLFVTVILSIHLSADVAHAFRFAEPNIVLTAVVFYSMFFLVLYITGLSMNHFSRHVEYRADNFAVNTTSKTDMINALKRISILNLINLNPNPVDVFMTYSHPPIIHRIEAINRIAIDNID
ncbi:MAG: M48 family metallopeptidase [Candidatus Izemoplasmatales bacterium]|jgi:STE24 endopeptidase|nr:M48 family metallopeptidase [Candidatus Izemoplasmatales bacterium]